MPEPEITASLSTLRRAVQRGAGLIALCTIVAAAAGFLFSQLQEERYTATALLVFEQDEFEAPVFGVETAPPADVVRELETEVKVISSDPVSAAAAETIGGELSGDDVSDAVDVEADIASDTATVNADDPDPALAAEMANAVAESFIEIDRSENQQALQGARESLRRQLEENERSGAGEETQRTLGERLGNLETLIALDAGDARLGEPATPPGSPSQPSTARNVAFGIVIGFLLGIVLAILRDRRRS